MYFFSIFQATSRHLACISVSSFHLACVQHRRWQKDHGVPESQWISIPDAGDLVNISQAKCSPSDMARMQDILTEKLNLNLDEDREPAISMLTLLRLMYRVSAVAAR